LKLLQRQGVLVAQRGEIALPDADFGDFWHHFHRFTHQVQLEHDAGRKQRFVAARPADDVDHLGAVQAHFVFGLDRVNVGDAGAHACLR